MAKAKEQPTHSFLSDEEVKKLDVLCKAKVFQMVVGVDLIGSKMSMAASKNISIDLTIIGAIAKSKNSNRHILIPWTNIKGVELFNE